MHFSGVFAQVMSASYPPHTKSEGECLIHLGAFVCVCVCVYPSSQSTGTNRNEELMASHSLIQIPVVPLRTSGVIISWCLILYLFCLSLPVVSMTYGVLSLKAADLFGMTLAIGEYLSVVKHSIFSPFVICFNKTG